MASTLPSSQAKTAGPSSRVMQPASRSASHSDVTVMAAQEPGCVSHTPGQGAARPRGFARAWVPRAGFRAQSRAAPKVCSGFEGECCSLTNKSVEGGCARARQMRSPAQSVQEHTPRAHTRRRDNIERCTICLEAFEVPDRRKRPRTEHSHNHSIAVINACGHVFHQQCWVEYVKTHIKSRARAAFESVRPQPGPRPQHLYPHPVCYVLPQPWARGAGGMGRSALPALPLQGRHGQRWQRDDDVDPARAQETPAAADCARAQGVGDVARPRG